MRAQKFFTFRILGVFAGIVIATSFVCRLKHHDSDAPLMVYDVLKSNEVIQTTIAPDVKTNGIDADDILGIRAALSRTPGVKHEILSISILKSEVPFAARVEVYGKLLYLFKDRNKIWHVCKIMDFHR